MNTVKQELSMGWVKVRPLWIESRRGLLSLIVAVLCALATLSAWPQDAPTLLINGNGAVAGSSIRVDIGRSEALRTTWRVKRVSVADPTVADVEALESNEILIIGKNVGKTDLIIWGEGGEIWSTEINVDLDIEGLNADLDRLFPSADVLVQRSGDVFNAIGVLQTAEQARQLHEFLTHAELQYVDMTTMAGIQQVQIKVRIAEVNRVAIKRMGVDLLKAGESFAAVSTPGSAAGGATNLIGISPAGGGAANANNIPFFFNSNLSTSPFNTLELAFPNADLELFVQALAENQYLRMLAEPTLVALSGEEASFLAGGEFPIPVVQGGGGGDSISIEYKEFGVRLSFTPTVLGDGQIRLHVAPEVSELSNVGGLQIQGASVPSILTRRAETTLELASGQTFAMAGLLNQSSNARNSRIPLLGDIPVLGSFFRSVTYQKGESELVVLVSANLVEPLNHASNRPVPGDLHNSPNDWDLFMGGKFEGKVKAPEGDDAGDADVAQVHELKGPGAWAGYHEEAAYEEARQPEAKTSTD